MINKIIDKIGIDRCAHFAFGGLICAMVILIFALIDTTEPLQWSLLLPCLLGTLITLGVELVKEFLIDGKADKIDILATMLGCVPVWLTVVLSIWLGRMFI